MTLDYFLESCIVALSVVVVLESLPYAWLIDFIFSKYEWKTKRYAYCSLCAGFWVGLGYFTLLQYYGNALPFWKGAFLTSGIAYTIKGLWLRLWGSEDNDD